jgi:hypothetical protein
MKLLCRDGDRQAKRGAGQLLAVAAMTDAARSRFDFGFERDAPAMARTVDLHVLTPSAGRDANLQPA